MSRQRNLRKLRTCAASIGQRANTTMPVLPRKFAESECVVRPADPAVMVQVESRRYAGVRRRGTIQAAVERGDAQRWQRGARGGGQGARREQCGHDRAPHVLRARQKSKRSDATTVRGAPM
jgi:hypothetical protein